MQQIIHLFPLHLREAIKESKVMKQPIEEVRVRMGQPIMVETSLGEVFIEGLRTYRITKEDMGQMVSYISKCSLYAFEEEIKKGYLTLEGGHRVGLAGQVIMDGNHVHNIRPITYLNIRVAHQIIGCAKNLVNALNRKNACGNVLILSAPGHGKTTILRDVVRLIAERYKVSIIDERSEIAGCYHGIPQNDVGMRTDILDGCPKSVGMMMMVRSMSPDYIAVDEIGSKEDVDAIHFAMNCGCRILATIHCSNIEELKRKPIWSMEYFPQMFDAYVVLHKTNDKREWMCYNKDLEFLGGGDL